MSVEELLPADLLEKLDETNVFSDDMELYPTSIALRATYLRDLLEREAGLRAPDFHPNPLAAQIEFTQRCNLKCEFCYNHSGPQNRDELDLPTLGRVCRELVEMEIVELIVSGGEPLGRPRHLEVILEIARAARIPVHLLTNGTLLTHERLEWLKQYGVLTLQVSLDGGDPGVHDTHRGMEGAWAKTMGALSRAHEHGFHTIVACTLTRANADTVGDLIDYCYRAGADRVNVGDLITWGRAHEWTALGSCTDEQYDRVAQQILDKRKQYGEWMGIELAINMLYYVCRIRIRGQENVLIRGNGDVIPHCTAAGLIAGNVHESSLRDIWDGSLAAVSEDPRLIDILSAHEILRTEGLEQLRCYRRVPS